MNDITNRIADMNMGTAVKKEQMYGTQAAKQRKEAQQQMVAAPKPKKIWKLEDFEIGPLKGEGKFGKVHIARVKNMNLVFAMKVMALKTLAPEQLERELSIHRELVHPHIVRLMTWFYDPVQVYIVMEMCLNGTIYEKMHAAGGRGFPQDVAAKYSAQLAEAVHYLHSFNPPILHRDVKPENTFLDANDNLKLGDFGWSALLKSKPRKTICGTLDYFAPELCKKEAYGKALDCWTVGVFIYEMCFGRPPFEIPPGASQAELMRKIQKSSVRFPETSRIGPGARDLVSQLLQKDPEKRINLDQALAHPWLQEYYYALKHAGLIKGFKKLEAPQR